MYIATRTLLCIQGPLLHCSIGSLIYFSTSTIDPTVATNALRKQRSLLLKLIRHCLHSLANSLFADSIIPQDVCERACNQTLTSSERGVALLDCVESRIEAVPSDFTKVVHILEGEGFLRPGAEELVKSYCESIQCDNATL